MRRLKCCSLAIVAILVSAIVLAATATDPIGTWQIEDGTAKVLIYRCGESLCGNVVWLSQPIDAGTGKPQTDKLNADPLLRSRPIIGVTVLIGLRGKAEENKWVGRIYNPDDGNTYDGS